MQPSILPGLLENAQHNMPNVTGTRGSRLRIFNWGQIFDKNGDHKLEFGALVSAKAETGIEDDPFLELKAALKNALKIAGHKSYISILKNSAPYMHPGRKAQIAVGKVIVGEIFEVHPTIAQNFGLPARSAACIINLSDLLDIKTTNMIAKPVSQFPGITYDVTIPFSQDKSVGELIKKIEKTSDLLENVEVAKLYSKEGMQEYNLTIRCTYRAADRTLKEEEVKEEHKAVLALVS